MKAPSRPGDILHAAFTLMDLITAKLKVAQRASSAIDQAKMSSESASLALLRNLLLPDMHGGSRRHMHVGS